MSQQALSYSDAVRGGLQRAGSAFVGSTAGVVPSDLVAMLLAAGPRERKAVIAEHRDRLGPAAVLLLLRQTEPPAPLDLTAAYDAACLAVRLSSVVETLDAVRADLRAQSWARLANCLRLRERFRGARRAWAKVAGFLSEGTQDVQLAFECLILRARLHRAERQFTEAGMLGEQALRMQEELANPLLEVDVRFFLASLRYEAGNLEAAFRDLIQALRLVSAEASPGYALPMLHALVVFLNDAGLEPYALRVSRMLEPAYGLAGSELFKLRGF